MCSMHWLRVLSANDGTCHQECIQTVYQIEACAIVRKREAGEANEYSRRRVPSLFWYVMIRAFHFFFFLGNGSVLTDRERESRFILLTLPLAILKFTSYRVQMSVLGNSNAMVLKFVQLGGCSVLLK
jgi:hypothetical protein